MFPEEVAAVDPEREPTPVGAFPVDGRLTVVEAPMRNGRMLSRLEEAGQ